VNLLLQDVERIEVIRGPGATVWGANALNGITNIITKVRKTPRAARSPEAVARERGFSGFRNGGKMGDDLYYRVWGKGLETGRGFSSNGMAHDGWEVGRGGF